MNHYSEQIISSDCKTITGLIPYIFQNPVLAIEVIPLLSLFCAETLSYFDKYNISIKAPNNNSFSVNDIRLKLKLFEDSFSKAQKMIANCDYLQDYIFKNLLKISSLTPLISERPG